MTSGIWHRCEIPCKTTSRTWHWHFNVCMIISSILSIPSGSTGSQRILSKK
ncbi:hypothetical protein F383_24470 [Gossypium arboreum]|uniref:Uncharacterized protein n=1 Tax=Gossypium arboreum TaxID=29729 RepID=A0A0B0PA42_GOSAR|nr:hypothetical protein F383_24470 [Gossypium arboreum]